MIWPLVRKELLLNLLSLRFAVGTAIVVVLMAVVGYPLVEEYGDRHQTYISDVARHRELLENTKVFSKIAVHFDIPPTPLSVFSRRDADLPSLIKIDPYHVPTLVESAGDAEVISIYGTQDIPVNPLLRVFTTIDLSNVIGIVLSLMAVFMVFDAFSGEREQGTLPLIMTCPVSRLELVVSKFLGGLITLSIPLLLGFTVVLLIWSLSPAIRLDLPLLSGIVVIFSSRSCFSRVSRSWPARVSVRSRFVLRSHVAASRLDRHSSRSSTGRLAARRAISAATGSRACDCQRRSSNEGPREGLHAD